MTFCIKSTEIANGYMNDKYGNKGPADNMIQGIPQTSFPIYWEDAPEGVKSFAVIFMDNDNAKDEGFPFVHWLVCDIPAACNCLEENASRDNRQMVQGTNSWSTSFGPYEKYEGEITRRFGGPAPEGCVHEYEMTIYALDCKLDLEEGFYYNDLRKEMRGHIIDRAKLLFMYG